MNSDTYRGIDNPRTSKDSFDVKLKQIEQTSNMLSSIENKLTDFFNRNRDQEAKIKETVKEIQQVPLKSNYTSPKHNIEDRSPYAFSKQQSPGRSIHKESPPSKFISIVDASHNDSQAQRHNSSRVFEQYLPQQSRGSPVSAREFSIRENRETATEIKYQDSRNPNYRASLAGSAQNESRGNIIIDRMNKMEDFYQNKIHILEERATNAERECQLTMRENSTLIEEIKKMRAEVEYSRDQLMNESIRSSYRQETHRIKDLERKLQDMENALTEANRRADKYAEKLESLRTERDYHSSEAARYRSRCEHIEDDYRQLNQKYQNLLQVHRQMTEPNLYDQEKQVPVSPNYRSNVFGSPSSLSKSREYNLGLGDSSNVYQRELETLKYSNSAIKKQFLQEIERLKNDGKPQREVNISPILKSRATPTSRISRTRRENDETELSRIIPTEFYLTRDDDFTRMSKHELENYARSLQSSYIKLEENLREYTGRSREGLEQFNRAYELIYGDPDKRTTARTAPITILDSKDSYLYPPTSTRKRARLVENSTTPPRRDIRGRQHEQNPEVLPKSARKKSLGVSFEKSKSRSNSRKKSRSNSKKKSKSKSKSKERKSSRSNKSYPNISAELEKLKKIVNSKFGEEKTSKKTPRKSLKNYSMITDRSATARIPINLSELRSGRSKSRSKSKSKSAKTKKSQKLKKSLSAKKSRS